MKLFFISILFAGFFLTACKKVNDPNPVNTTVSVTGANPVTGVYGTVVTITGTNFSPTAASNNVKINGVTAIVTSATATALQVVVPPKAGTGLITVQVNSQTATGPTWTHIYQGTVSTFAGSGIAGYADGTGTAAQFKFVISGVCADAGGNLFIAEFGSSRIRKITPGGVVTTIAGTGVAGFMDGPAATAQFNSLRGITADGSGNLYIADVGNHRIRKLSPAGMVTTFAGTGVNGFADGPGNMAQFSFPSSLVYDNSSGNLYCGDQNYRLRKITAAGEVSSVAGNGISGFANGTGTAAQFTLLNALCLDPAGNIYAADGNNHRIRKITPAGVVTTYAGNGTTTNTDGPVATASIYLPTGIASDANGNIYAAQPFANRIRKISTAGIVSTLAGKGSAGLTNGPGNIAEFNAPWTMTMTIDGIIYVLDADNHVIRKILIE